MPNVSFQLPNDYSPYSVEQADIQRRLYYAQALGAQSMQPVQQQTAGGWVIPTSPMQGIAKVFQGYVANKGLEDATNRQNALSLKYRTDLSNALTNAQQAIAGTPGVPASPAPSDASGGGPAYPGQPAVPGSREKMIQALMSHPATQPLAMQVYGRDLAMQSVFGNQGGNQQATNPPAGVPYGGGSSQGVPDMTTIQRAMLSGDPSLQMWGKEMLGAMKGIAARPGAPVVNGITGQVIAQPAPQSVPGVGVNIGPNGPSAYPVPGAAPAMAGIAGQVSGAQAAAKVPYEPITTAGGAKMPAYMVPGFQPPGAAPSVPPSPSPAPQSGLPQKTWQAVGDQGSQAQQAVIAQAKQASDQGQPFSQVVDESGSSPWDSMPKRAVPQGIGQNTFDKSMSDFQASSANALATKYGGLADAANQKIALNNQSLSLIDKADTGPMAARIGTLKNWLVSNFGVPEGYFANTPSATLALQKDLVNQAVQKAKSLFPKMTQGEVMLMLGKGSPNIDMTKSAIKYLISSDSMVAQYQINQANDLGTYMQRGGDPQRFEGWYSQAFPLTGDLSGVHMGGNSPAAPPTQSAPSGQDAAALGWANANPRDPRATAIKQRLGAR